MLVCEQTHIWVIALNSRYLTFTNVLMRVLFSLLLSLLVYSASAQTWEDELILTIREINPKTTEQGYKDALVKLDVLAKKYRDVWQPAYYAAWYKTQFLQRADFKTQQERENYLFQAAEGLKPYIKNKPNEELYILNAYIQLVRVMWDNEAAFAKYSATIQRDIDAARQFSPEHPRLKLVEGLYAYYNYSDDENARRDRCRELLLQAEEGFKMGFTTSYPMMPSWGWDIDQHYLSLLR